MSSVETIHSEILRCLTSSGHVNHDKNILVVGTHNALYGNREKAQQHLPVYREFVRRHHLLAWQEVDQQFLELIADASEDYAAYWTEPNSRGQAIGFTVHKRLQVTGTTIFTEMQNIGDIPDLRPALCLDLKDRTTGLNMTALVVHFKSNHGGAVASRDIRYQQAKAQGEAMQRSDKFTICLGDFNQILEVASDTDPLLSQGFRLVPRYDQASTHASGDRMDGMFVKNIPPGVKITRYKVRNFWRNNLVGCAFSDHGLLTWNIRIA